MTSDINNQNLFYERQDEWISRGQNARHEQLLESKNHQHLINQKASHK